MTKYGQNHPKELLKRPCWFRVSLIIKRCDYVGESAPSRGLSKSYHGHQDYSPTKTGWKWWQQQTLRDNDINARTRAGGACCHWWRMLELAINSKGRDVGKCSETRVLSCFCITLGPGLNKDIKQVMQRFHSKGQTNTGAHSGGSCYKRTKNAKHYLYCPFMK